MHVLFLYTVICISKDDVHHTKAQKKLITTRTEIQSPELVSDTVGKLNNKERGNVCPFNTQEQRKQSFLCGLNRDLTPQTGSRQLGLSRCWQMGERDELFTVNFKGCKYYVDVTCMTVE